MMRIVRSWMSVKGADALSARRDLSIMDYERRFAQDRIRR
jgi:hypothetical protein